MIATIPNSTYPNHRTVFDDRTNCLAEALLLIDFTESYKQYVILKYSNYAGIDVQG